MSAGDPRPRVGLPPREERPSSDESRGRGELRSAGGLVVLAPLRLEALVIAAGGRRLRVRRTGMGPRRAGEAASALRDDPARALVVMGVCGGLAVGDTPGEVVIADDVSSADEHGRRDVPIACTGGAALVEALAREGLRARRGSVASTARIIHGQGRVRLREAGADVVDMESAWLAPAARGRPFAVIRVVADTPTHDLRRPVLAVGGWVRAVVALRRTAAAVQRQVSELGIEAVLGGM